MTNVADVQRAAADLGPVALAARLGFRVGPRSHRGACPVHGGKNPESFALDCKGGTIVAACHSCGFGGDVIDLVGALEGLTDFPDKLKMAAEILGVELDESAPRTTPARVIELATYRETQAYPDADEVCGLWNSCPAGEFSADALRYLDGRGYEAQTLRELDLVREIQPDAKLPPWARIRGRSWTDAGYRLIVQAYDDRGCVRSLRGWRVTTPGDGLPKRLAPAGKRASGLVTANAKGALLLSLPQYFVQRRVQFGDSMIVRICEGEPDLLWLSAAFPAECILAVTSATAWPAEVGERIPSGATIVVYPHVDAAGAKLTDAVLASVGNRCDAYVADIGAAS